MGNTAGNYTIFGFCRDSLNSLNSDEFIQGKLLLTATGNILFNKIIQCLSIENYFRPASQRAWIAFTLPEIVDATDLIITTFTAQKR